ncbi:MAG: hypothetical protein ACRD50_09360 [Candidatus Acidiferrales bacterium]
MRKIWLVFFAVAALAFSTFSQSQSSAQATGSSNTQASASTGKSGVQTQASSSNSTSAQAGGDSLALDSGTTANAELLSTLDARHSKPGDRVVAKTTRDVKQNGHVVMRKGTKLVGHVTQAQARSKENAQSSLGIIFDTAVMRDGKEVPAQFVIQALAAARSDQTASLDNGDMMEPVAGGGSGSVAGGGRAGGGGLVGGATGTVGSSVGATAGTLGEAGRPIAGTVGTTTGVAGGATGHAGGLDAAGMLTSTSSGVFGLQGMNLTSQASNATEGSLVTSPTHNVRLVGGTQMLLSATTQHN